MPPPTKRSAVEIYLSSQNGSDQENMGTTSSRRDDSPSRVVADQSEGSLVSSNTSGREYSMARIIDENPTHYHLLAEKVEEMGGVFFRYFFGQDCQVTRRYLADVFIYTDDTKLPRILECLSRYGESRRNGMFGYSVEEKHVHIVHDCNFGGSWCRDTFRQQIKPYGYFMPARKQNKPLWQFTRIDFYDVFIYYFLRKRGDRQIWVRGENWKAPTDGK